MENLQDTKRNNISKKKTVVIGIFLADVDYFQKGYNRPIKNRQGDESVGP